MQVITNSLLTFQFLSVGSDTLQHSITAATRTVKAPSPEAHSIKEKTSSFYMRNGIEAGMGFTRLVLPLFFLHMLIFRVLPPYKQKTKPPMLNEFPSFYSKIT